MDEVSIKLIDEYQVKKISSTNIFYFGTYCRVAKFFKDVIPNKKLLDYGVEAEELILNRDKVIDDLLNSMRGQLHREIQAPITELPESGLNFSEFILLTSIKDAQQMLFNTFSETVSPVSAEALMLPMDKEDKAFFMDNMRYCEFIYNPLSPRKYQMSKLHGRDFMEFNSHVPADWRVLPEIVDAVCPEIIAKMLNYLFLDGPSLDYTLDWIYTCIESRNEVYLVLNGSKGVGKGLLTSLVKSLLGSTNALDAPLSSFTSQFMAALDNNRLVVFDEFTVGKKEHTRLKRLANKFQTIEKKGIDADKAILTHNSFIISNNDTSDMYLEGDDRRFSVPNLNTKRMTDIWTKEEMDEIIKAVEEPNTIYKFGQWILQRGLKTAKDFNSFSREEFRSNHFHLLVYTSLAEWQRFMVDHILDSEEAEIELAEIRKAFTREFKELKFPRKFSKISDFLTNYRHEGVMEIGELVREDHEAMFIRVFKNDLNFL